MLILSVPNCISLIEESKQQTALARFNLVSDINLLTIFIITNNSGAQEPIENQGLPTDRWPHVHFFPIERDYEHTASLGVTCG